MRVALAALTLALATGFAAPLAAQEEKPIQLALLAPVQLFPESDAVKGVRVSLIYGKNAAVTGLDFGLINHTTLYFNNHFIGILRFIVVSLTG